MNRSVFSLICIGFWCFSLGQTNLSSGDIALVEYNADNPDNFSFVVLSTMDSGTQIKFTDKGWDSAGFFRSGEGTMTWIAPFALSCGDLVHVDSAWGISLSASGDQLLAYQGSDSFPSFITALNAEGQAQWQVTASSSTSSALPIGLRNGDNATALFEKDNLKYQGMVSGSLSQIKSAIFDSTNFVGSDASQQNFTDSFNISGACALPVQFLSFEYEIHDNWVDLSWATSMEWNNSHFEILKSLDGVIYFVIGLVQGAGQSNDIKYYSWSQPQQEAMAYYRIKQVDYDGNTTYSKTISVILSDKPKVILSKEFLMIRKDGKWTLKIYTLDGRLIDSRDFENEIELNRNDVYDNLLLIILVSRDRTGLYDTILYRELLTSK